MSSATTSVSLPSGFKVLTSFPDILVLPEFVFGGLVWILVASTRVLHPMIQGWVMFVSVYCFVLSTLLLFLYFCGAHREKSAWVAVDAFYQVTASLFYLSAAVLQAYATISAKDDLQLAAVTSNKEFYHLIYKTYQIDIAAVVFAFLATLSYVIHMTFSLLRWKSS